jgi:hypothetical protein
VQHPPPEDQYAVDPRSVQRASSGPGHDWAYFGCFANPNTGLTAAQVQGAWFELARAAPMGEGQIIRITGYGTDNDPPEWNQVLQTASGPYEGATGTMLEYAVDTGSGNSGSPVIEEYTGLAIGIHTHGACTHVRGANIGTAIEHPALAAALADPQGVCIPECAADIDGSGAVDVSDLLLVLLAWGQGPGPADVTGDGVVDVLDLIAVLSAWGACS